MLDPWDSRPSDTRSLFNPAFCGALIATSVKAYQKTVSDQQGMPLLKSHLILPLLLHSETRRTFPATTKTSLTRWLENNPQVRVGLAGRILGCRPFTLEAIRFAIAGQILQLNEQAHLIHVRGRPRGLEGLLKQTTSNEVQHCFKFSKDLGRWFARVPDTTFLYYQFRVLP
ncbi:three component ABC system middle component [Bremerella cremea]|uniref:three component ABC system middle component n=1 Tax=Bremerella cremea TaxID=1031537 RepID=UPI00268A5A53